MLNFKHFFYFFTKNNYMKTMLIITAISIIILTTSLNVNADVQYDIYTNIGKIKIKIYGITIFSGDISFVAGYFNLFRKTKKVIQLKIDFNSDSIRFFKNISDNLKQKIYLTNFETNICLSSKSASNVSILGGYAIVLGDLLASKISASNSEIVMENNVAIGYTSESFKLGVNMSIYVCLFDGVWAFSRAILQRRWYGKG